MLNYMVGYVWSQLQNQKGQGMVEYGIIVAFIAVVCIGAFTALGGQIDTLIGGIKLKTAAGTGTTP